MASAANVASADLITAGFTFAVASADGDHSIGTHFHSNTGGAFGNLAGKAEVGAFAGEEVVGLSEYNLAGLTAGPAFVTFNVFKAGGLTNFDPLDPIRPFNNFPFAGVINLVAYQGNNRENLSDFQAPSIKTVGSFSTSSLLVGNILSFDITSLLAMELNGGFTSLGIRLEDATDPAANIGAWTFDGFRLTNTNDTTAVVPEPGTILLLGTGLFGMMICFRRPLLRRRQSL